jgi:hypothetical protein
MLSFLSVYIIIQAPVVYYSKIAFINEDSEIGSKGQLFDNNVCTCGSMKIYQTWTWCILHFRMCYKIFKINILELPYKVLEHDHMEASEVCSYIVQSLLQNLFSSFLLVKSNYEIHALERHENMVIYIVSFFEMK